MSEEATKAPESPEAVVTTPSGGRRKFDKPPDMEPVSGIIQQFDQSYVWLIYFIMLFVLCVYMVPLVKGVITSKEFLKLKTRVKSIFIHSIGDTSLVLKDNPKKGSKLFPE